MNKVYKHGFKQWGSCIKYDNIDSPVENFVYAKGEISPSSLPEINLLIYKTTP